jgi:hypothetical protein
MIDIPEFRSFGKILHINKLCMSITQKIHGTNAQIYIYKNQDGILDLVCGSRSRWLSPDDDNHGFAKFVQENKQEFIDKLGEGRHFGEWCGPGINAGEGLKEKILCLFNWRRWSGKELPVRTSTVPLLYDGPISLQAINNAMDLLKGDGSMLVPGYKKPEGIVIELDGQFYKNVFDNEEVKWKEKVKILSSELLPDISYLLQPLRLEKLLSRDERYLRNYPKTLSDICSDYVKDLEAEKQFKAQNEDELKVEKKSLGKQIFYFVKSIVNSKIEVN